MRSMRRQQGVTGLGWLIILGLIAFFVSLGLKIYPIYWENYNIKSSLSSLAKTQGISRMSRAKIRSRLQAKLDVNNIRNLKKSNIKINKRNGAAIVTIDYTVKVPLVGALSLLAEFHERIEAVN